MVERGFIDLDTLSKPPTASAPAFGGERRKRAVHELCAMWARAVKTICLYPSSNPLPDEFRGKFYDALNAILEDHGRLVIQTSETGFSFDGENVYEPNVGEENLAYLFFKDGIRELSFDIGATHEESDRFLEIGADAMASTGRGVDIANRLWEAALPHIKHFTVDRIVEGTYIEPARDEQISAVHEKFISSMAGAPVPVEAPKPESPYAGLQRERHLHVLQVFGDVAALAPGEVSEVTALIRPEAPEAAEALGLDIIMEILRAAENPRMVDDAISVLHRQFELAVAADRWGMARRLLIELRGVMGQVQEKTSPKLSDALVRMGDRRTFERLTRYLNSNPQGSLDPIHDLLSLFGTSAIASVTAMLGSLEHRPARLMVCDFLIANGRETVDLIGGFIYDKRWYVSRNIAKILGEIGNERGVNFLKKSATHTDARVRLETLRAAKRILGPDAERILRGFLKDPEVDLRKRALRALGDINGTSAIPDLKAQLDSETLPDLDPQEMGELLRAYARVGGDQAVRELVDLARRATFFKRGRWQPVRMAAIRALAAARGLSAPRALESLGNDSNEEIARTARAAMAARERLMESDSESDDDRENEDEL